MRSLILGRRRRLEGEKEGKEYLVYWLLVKMKLIKIKILSMGPILSNFFFVTDATSE
jgi:hypothetical protein